jgi:hypothetical protein
LSRFLPRDALAYLELRDLQDGITKVKSLLHSAFGEQRYQELREDALDLLDELHKGILKAITSVQQIGIAFYWEGPIIALGSSSSGVFGDLLKSLKEEDILEPLDKVGETPIYKLGRGRICLYLASIGSHVWGGMELGLLKKVILQYTNKGLPGSLHEHPLYREAISGIPEKGFSMVGFWDIKAHIRLARLHSPRLDIYEFDAICALLGLDRFEAITLRTSWKGYMKEEINIKLRPDTVVYELIRQGQTQKRGLNFVSKGTLAAISLTLTDPLRTWEKIKAFAQEVDSFVEEYGLHEIWGLNDVANQLEEAEEDLGIGFKEIAQVLGDEVTLVIDSPTLFHIDFQGGMSEEVFYSLFMLVVRLKDLKRAKGLVQNVISKGILSEFEDFRERKYRGVKIMYTRLKKGFYFAYAFVDPYLVMAFDLGMVKEAIKAYKAKRSILQEKEVKGMLPLVEARNSLCLLLNYKNLYNLVSMILPFFTRRFRLPQLSRDFKRTYMAIAIDLEERIKLNSWGEPGIITTSLLLCGLGIGYNLYKAWDHLVVCELPEIEELKEVKPLKLPDDPQELDRILSSLVNELGVKEKREGAIKGLKGAGKLAVPYVKRLLGSKDRRVRRAAQDILLYLGEFDLVPELAREYVEEALDLIGSEMRLWETGGNFSRFRASYLNHLLKDKHLGVLRSKIGRKEWLKAILNEKLDYVVRKNAAYVAFHLRLQFPAGPIVELLNKEEREDLRPLLILLLGSAKGKEAQEYLNLCLKDEISEKEWVYVHRAIAVREERDCIPRLISILGSEEVFERFNAGLTLLRLTKVPLYFNAFEKGSVRARQIAAWKQWWEKEEKR